MRDDHWPKFNSERTAIGFGSRGIDHVVCEKIESAFRNVKSFPLERIIFQFWQPVKPSPGATVLSCSGTPFAYSPPNHRLRRYSSRCSLYKYGVSGLINDSMIITHAPPAYAFVTKFPEVVLDLSVHKGTPLVDLALECELSCFMMLPLFHETSCVGIIEVSARYPRHLPVMFDELHRELKRVGLSCIYRPTAIYRPLKGMPADGLSLARSEAAKALKVAILSHDITLGLVWMPFHDRLTSSRLLCRLSAHYLSTSDGMSLGKHFYDHLVCLPLDNGPVIIARTLETRQPHLCRNICKFTENKGLMKLLSVHTRSSCFVICLRSSHTGDLDLVFEFFWPRQRDHLPLMEALVLTLRQHLPSFKYDSGAQLGDQLLVVDVENSSSTNVKIFPQNERALVAGMKRKTRASARMERESLTGQSELNQNQIQNQFPLTNINNLKDEEEDDNDDNLVILAVYKVDKRLLFLPTSHTFESLVEKINAEFELNIPAGNYEIEYQVLPGEWYSLTDDTCLKSCISSYRASTKINHIKLSVVHK